MTTEKWHIASSTPRHEEAAEKSLKREGFEAYYPTYRLFVTPARKTVTPSRRHNLVPVEVIRPLFPGYLFVRPKAGVAIDRIFDMVRDNQPGIMGLVHFGWSLATVPSKVIAAIQDKAASGALDVHTGRFAFPFKLRDSVRLKEGPFTGFTAIVERLDESDSITLLLDLFGRKCRVVSSAEQLEVA